MERQEQLKFCKVCVNKKMDFKLGLICAITDNHASFESECVDFKDDGRAEELAAIKRKINNKNAKNGKTDGKNDMLIGALWFVGGIIFTASDVGYIAWGAIIYGGFQFMRGAFAQS